MRITSWSTLAKRAAIVRDTAPNFASSMLQTTNENERGAGRSPGGASGSGVGRTRAVGRREVDERLHRVERVRVIANEVAKDARRGVDGARRGEGLRERSPPAAPSGATSAAARCHAASACASSPAAFHALPALNAHTVPPPSVSADS